MEMERLRLTRLAERIPSLFTLVSTRHQAHISQLAQRLSSAISHQLERGHARCNMLQMQYTTALERRLQQERHQLELLEQRAKSLDPALLLSRGYSITLHQGKAIRRATDLRPGDLIETRLSEGSLQSVIQKATTESQQK
jgi:exodeoxyribonuclease VII large subunit